MTDIVLVKSARQEVWGWPAVLNFSLGGMGTGCYLVAAMVASFWTRDAGETSLVIVKILSAGLVIVGFLALTVEAGRPAKSYYLLHGLKHSWMSLESLAGLLFVVIAILEAVFPSGYLQALASLAAFVFLISQSFIVYRARGIANWNSLSTFLLFLFSSLSSGAGAIFLMSTELAVLPATLLAGSVLLLLNLAVWSLFVVLACKPKRTRLAVLISVVQVLPLLLLLPFVAGLNAPAELQVAAFKLIGFLMIFAGVSQKAVVIKATGYLREFTFAWPDQDETQVHREQNDGGSHDNN